MELGNMVFGHSCGTVPVKCGPWEAAFVPLLEVLDYPGGAVTTYGTEFSNEVFEMHKYWWTDCTCGFDDEECIWLEQNKHSSQCIGKLVNNKAHEIAKDYGSVLHGKGNVVFKKWLAHNNIPYQGCMLACDCGWEQKYQEWRKDHNHTDDCCLVRPNFWYKPTNYKIWWYKYPFRDSYANNKISLKTFNKIVSDCMSSFKGEQV